MIEEGHAYLEGMRHAHRVSISQQSVYQIRARFHAGHGRKRIKFPRLHSSLSQPIPPGRYSAIRLVAPKQSTNLRRSEKRAAKIESIGHRFTAAQERR